MKLIIFLTFYVLFYGLYFVVYRGFLHLMAEAVLIKVLENKGFTHKFINSSTLNSIQVFRTFRPNPFYSFVFLPLILINIVGLTMVKMKQRDYLL